MSKRLLKVEQSRISLVVLGNHPRLYPMFMIVNALPRGTLDFGRGISEHTRMTREAIIARLRALQPQLNAEGIARLYLFGSVLRDEAGAESDVDLFFDHDLPSFGLLEYVHLKDVASSLMGREIDLIARCCLHPKLRARVEAEALRVF